MHLGARWLVVFPREQNTKADNGPEIAVAADTVSLIVREPPLIGRVQHYIGLVRHSLTLFSITTDNGVKKQPPLVGDLKFKLPDPGICLIHRSRSLVRSDTRRCLD